MHVAQTLSQLTLLCQLTYCLWEDKQYLIQCKVRAGQTDNVHVAWQCDALSGTVLPAGESTEFEQKGHCGRNLERERETG